MPRTYQRRDPIERFFGMVDAMGDCWEWTASTRNGYGQFAITSRAIVRAHRFAWQLLVGPIPADKVLDHLCRNRRCVNPDHLELVTRRVNTLRGYGRSMIAMRTNVCQRGHAFTEANTMHKRAGQRNCRACVNAARRRKKQERRVREVEAA